jgi:hypothetical protein
MLSACALLVTSALVAVTGSGTPKTEPRPVGAFESVSASGSFTVEIVSGGAAAVEVTADDNLLKHITTTVKDGVLHIGGDKTSITPKTPVVVKVTAPRLQKLSASGSGSLSAADVAPVPEKTLELSLSGSGKLSWKGPAEAVSLQLSGSGTSALVGNARSLDANISGSGALDALAFEVKSATLRVSGSGNAKVNAAETLNVTVSGSGSVLYAGAPAVTKKVTGSGTVRAKDTPAEASVGASDAAKGTKPAADKSEPKPKAEKSGGGW